MRLTKVEKYAIQWLSSQGMSVSDIAHELTVSEKPVNNYLEKFKSVNEENKIKTTSEPVAKKKANNLMIHTTEAKKERGVTIMTKAASEVSDQHVKTAKSHRDKSAIHRPLDR